MTCIMFNYTLYALLFISVSLAVPPTVENAKVTVSVSADSRRALATYSAGGIHSILGNRTLAFDCDSGWSPVPPTVTGKLICTTLQCLHNLYEVHIKHNVLLTLETNIKAIPIFTSLI